jgi:hypothetical protein
MPAETMRGNLARKHGIELGSVALFAGHALLIARCSKTAFYKLVSGTYAPCPSPDGLALPSARKNNLSETAKIEAVLQASGGLPGAEGRAGAGLGPDATYQVIRNAGETIIPR